ISAGARADVRGPEAWLHRVAWKPAPALLPGPADGPARWLILADRLGVGRALARALSAGGAQATLASSGSRFEPEDFDRLVREALPPPRENLSSLGVVHLWSLDAAAIEATEGATSARASMLGAGSALLLVQSLVRLAGAAAVRLAFVTRGGKAALGRLGAAPMSQAPIWGLGGTVALEHPELGLIRVNLDPAGTSAEEIEA